MAALLIYDKQAGRKASAAYRTPSLRKYCYICGKVSQGDHYFTNEISWLSGRGSCCSDALTMKESVWSEVATCKVKLGQDAWRIEGGWVLHNINTENIHIPNHFCCWCWGSGLVHLYFNVIGLTRISSIERFSLKELISTLFSLHNHQ